MAEFQISCVIKDTYGIVRRVGLDNGRLYPIKSIVDSIPEHTFFTYKEGHMALVHKKQNPTTGNWFLTTNPDSWLENNLDFLRPCNQS